MFTTIGRVFAVLLYLVGIASILLGIQHLFSAEIEVRYSNGLPLGPKVPALTQGFQIFCAGVALGVLTDISARLSTKSVGR
jgi:hypothetical protein